MVPVGLAAVEFGQELDEDVDLRRHEVAARIDGVDRDGSTSRDIPAAPPSSAPLSNSGPMSQVERRPRPRPASSASRTNSAEFERMLPLTRSCCWPSGPSQAPDILGAGRQAVVEIEIGERLRRADASRDTSARADHAMVGGELAGDERAVLQFADADREVEAFADDVDEAVGQVEIELDLGILGQEVRQVGRDVQPAERRRRRHLEQAARLGVAAADEILRLLDQAQDVDDALEVAFAGLGQRQLAGGALEQARPEPLLEQADALGHDGGRQAHLAAGGRHVAGAGDACENVEIADGGHRRYPSTW